MHFTRWNFAATLRNAIDDEEVSSRIRSALAALCDGRRDDDPLGQDEKRLWAMLPAIRAGRANEEIIINLARKITNGR